MAIDDLTNMSHDEHMQFLQSVGFADLRTHPSEENMLALVSEAMQTESPAAQARVYIEIANMCIALADKTLGYQGFVPQVFELPRH